MVGQGPRWMMWRERFTAGSPSRQQTPRDKLDASAARTMLRILRPHASMVPLLVMLGLLASAAEGFGLALLIPLFSTVLGNSALPGPAGPLVNGLRSFAELFDEDTRAAVVAATVIGLILLKSAISYGFAALSIALNGRVGHALRSKVFRGLLICDYADFAHSEPGKLVNAVAYETWRATQASGIVCSMIISGCTVVVFAALLMLISPELSLAVGAGVLVTFALVRPLARQARRLGASALAAYEHFTGDVLRAFQGMRVIRLFGQETHEQEVFDRSSRRLQHVIMRMALLGAGVRPLVEVLYAALFVAIFFMAWSTGVELPTLFTFLVMLYRMQPHISGLEQGRVGLSQLSDTLAKVAGGLDRQDRPPPRGGAMFGRFEDAIVFDDVSFRYRGDPDDRAPLADVSFAIEKGKMTVIAGKSGAGKSTVVGLLFRLFEPTEGRILVDGRSLNDFDLASWRAVIAFAGQDADLMDGTIRDNIAYGTPGARREEIVAAARWAGAHEFIEGLPHGYDAKVGERGLRLSGGQRQRIALARALLRRPQVLVLDEATGSLEDAAEVDFYATVKRLDLTCVVITHRPSVVRHAGHLVVLDGGRVIEREPSGAPPPRAAADVPIPAG
jgi:subfamily B ATP-binding cassette protein MsbA